MVDAGRELGIPLSLRGHLGSDPGSLTALKPGTGEVLLVAGPLPASADWLAGVRASGKGIIVLGSLTPTDRHAWAERLPIVFVPADPPAGTLGLAILSAEGAAKREVVLRNEIEQLQQRLQDRILLERAKGVLVQRLSVNEEEAYRRLRASARKQRRPLRDVARSILDTDSLLDVDQTTNSAVGEDTQR